MSIGGVPSRIIARVRYRHNRVEASGWFGVGAPSNTPVEIIDKLDKEIDAGVADPKMKERLADLGGIALTGSPSDFGKLIVEETEKWGKVVKFAGVKAD